MIAAGILLYLMFSTGEAPDRSEGLFGTFFFEAVTNASGSTGVTMGVDKPAGLIALFAVLLVLSVMTNLIFLRLKDYKAGLMRSGAHG